MYIHINGLSDDKIARGGNEHVATVAVVYSAGGCGYALVEGVRLLFRWPDPPDAFVAFSTSVMEVASILELKYVPMAPTSTSVLIPRLMETVSLLSV